MSPTDASDDAWHSVMPLSELPAGEVAEVVVQQTLLAVGNVDGELFALDGLCAHQGGSLGKGKLCGGTLTCPWHGWQYDVANGCQLAAETGKPTEMGQRTYPIRHQQGTIQVYMAPR